MRVLVYADNREVPGKGGRSGDAARERLENADHSAGTIGGRNTQTCECGAQIQRDGLCDRWCGQLRSLDRGSGPRASQAPIRARGRRRSRWSAPYAGGPRCRHRRLPIILHAPASKRNTCDIQIEPTDMDVPGSARCSLVQRAEAAPPGPAVCLRILAVRSPLEPGARLASRFRRLADRRSAFEQLGAIIARGIVLHFEMQAGRRHRRAFAPAPRPLRCPVPGPSAPGHSRPLLGSCP